MFSISLIMVSTFFNLQDFQSIELRLLAHFSEDPLLLQIFNRSEDDIFLQLASLW